MAQKSLLMQVAEDPMAFAIGIGVANGVLAAVRNKPVSQRALYATAGVLAVGETILLLDEPEDHRPALPGFMIKTALGVFLGLAPFVSWQPGEKTAVQRGGEWMGDFAHEHFSSQAA